jgi:Flp pilus assembly pilin Flp
VSILSSKKLKFSCLNVQLAEFLTILILAQLLLCSRCVAAIEFSLNGISSKQEGGEIHMELFKRLLVEEEGQGLVEYTLIVVLVALVFWVAIKQTNIGSGLAAGWSKVTACVGSPSSCDSSS